MEQREWIVEAEAEGQRIDRFLSGEDTGLSRSALQNLVADGHVRCNGKAVATSLKSVSAPRPARGRFSHASRRGSYARKAPAR